MEAIAPPAPGTAAHRNTHSWPEIVAIMQARGMRYVRTVGGRIAIDDPTFRPYGASGEGWRGFIRPGENAAVDYVDPTSNPVGFALGVWSFYPDAGPTFPLPAYDQAPHEGGRTYAEAREAAEAFKVEFGDGGYSFILHARTPADAARMAAYHRAVRTEVATPADLQLHVWAEVKACVYHDAGVYLPDGTLVEAGL